MHQDNLRRSRVLLVIGRDKVERVSLKLVRGLFSLELFIMN